MSVSETTFQSHSASLQRLFREYHEWNKDQAITMFGGEQVPVELIESDYDIAAIIDADIDYLSDPETNSRMFVAENDDAVVGCVFLQWRTQATAEVKRLYVEPEARGQGMGRALMEAVIDAARDDGCTRLLLQTGPYMQAAQSLYHDLGFDETAPFDAEPPEEIYDDWVFMAIEFE